MLEKILINEEEYTKYVTESLQNFEKLCKQNHPYKEKEEAIFKEYYEDDYHVTYFNIDECVSYAKKSSKILLKILMNESGTLYSVANFDKEAFTEEVLNYIKENNRIDDIYMWNNFFGISGLLVLKIKKHHNFFFELPEHSITDEIIECLREINFKSHEIDEYINNKKDKEYPKCLNSPKFILFLLEENIDNIKYLKGDSISEELVEYLLKHNYKYKLDHNIELLKNPRIFDKTIKDKEAIDFVLENDIEIGDENIERLLLEIKNTNHNCWNLKNKFLLQSYTFPDNLAKYLNLDNPYNLRKECLITNLGRNLSELSTIFSNNDIEIIKRELVENKYFIDLNGIINNINLIKLKEIYDKLYQKDNKFNNNFSFYYFIKVMEYFANNLSLANELNNNEINDSIIDNLSMAIATNDKVNYEQLKTYIESYKKEIDKEDLLVKQKISKLLINKTSNVDEFLNDVLNPLQLTYLQLEFSKDSVEYKLLESYIKISGLLKNISTIEDNDHLSIIYKDLLNSFKPNSLFDAHVMRENILRLYSNMYSNMKVDYSKLEQKGKAKTVNGKKIIDITGEKFCLFIHNPDFQVEADFTGYDPIRYVKNKNYICTELESDLYWHNLTKIAGVRSSIHIYNQINPTSLIAFGNKDVFIRHTKKPLIEALDKYVNPFDMACFYKRGAVNNEFDFLRIDDKNIKFEPDYIILKDQEEVLKHINDCDKTILVFNEKLHVEYLQNEMNNMLQNIELLNYKQLYRLLALLYKFKYTEYDVERIQNRINELDEKEQFILNDALNRYLTNTKNKENENRSK